MHLAGLMGNMSLSTGLVISSPFFASILVTLLTPDNDNESAGFLLTALMVNTQQSVSWHLTAKMLFVECLCYIQPQRPGSVSPCASGWVSDRLKCQFFLWFNNNNYPFFFFLNLRTDWTEPAVFVLALSLCHTQTYLGGSVWGKIWGVCVLDSRTLQYAFYCLF